MTPASRRARPRCAASAACPASFRWIRVGRVARQRVARERLLAAQHDRPHRPRLLGERRVVRPARMPQPMAGLGRAHDERRSRERVAEAAQDGRGRVPERAGRVRLAERHARDRVVRAVHHDDDGGVDPARRDRAPAGLARGSDATRDVRQRRPGEAFVDLAPPRLPREERREATVRRGGAGARDGARAEEQRLGRARRHWLVRRSGAPGEATGEDCERDGGATRSPSCGDARSAHAAPTIGPSRAGGFSPRVGGPRPMVARRIDGSERARLPCSRDATSAAGPRRVREPTVASGAPRARCTRDAPPGGRPRRLPPPRGRAAPPPRGSGRSRARGARRPRPDRRCAR